MREVARRTRDQPASLPLFTGFGRMARVNRSRETLAQLQFEREATAERIATRIRTSLYESGASFANIDLAREAARAANRNYELVLDGYREGVVSILDLLDAQTEALNANLDAAKALLNRIEQLRAQFENDSTMWERLRQMVRQFKTDLDFIAGSPRAGQKRRELAREVAQWLVIWLQNPQIFTEWLALRQNTVEFRERFLS